jgi:hypothetical protein
MVPAGETTQYTMPSRGGALDEYISQQIGGQSAFHFRQRICAVALVEAERYRCPTLLFHPIISVYMCMQAQACQAVSSS